MELTAPDVKYKESYLAAAREFRAENRHEGENLEKAEADFPAFVEYLKAQADGKNLKEGYVPQTTFWLVDGGEYIGEIRIRHALNEFLKNIGGHIGYAVRPTKRRMGYGTRMLELALPEAKKLGIERALITCDASNTGSRRIIEANGGEFENEVPGENGPKRRYWVAL